MRRTAGALVGLALAVVAVLAAAPALAQDAPALTIRSVDATDPQAVQVTFAYAGDRADLTDLVVREGDRVVDASTAVPLSDQQALGIVLAIDASGSMADGALIERVIEAAHDFIDGKAVADQMAIVTFNSEVRVVQEFTTDPDLLHEAVDEIALGPETAVYDAIVRSAALFEDSSLQPNVIVFSDGGDTVSSSSPDRARAAIENVGGALFAVGVENRAFAILETIAAETGGTAAAADDPRGVGQLFEDVQATLAKQYVVTYASRAEGRTASLTLTVGSAQASAEFVSGSSQAGSAALQPETVGKPSGPAFFRSSTGLVVALALVALAAVGIVASVGDSFFGKESTLDTALQPYAEGFVAPSEGDDDTGGARTQQLVQVPILQRAVEATGQFAERQGLLTKVESQLDRANLPLRPAEALFFYAVGVVIVALLVVALSGDLFPTVVATAAVALVPPALLAYLARRRQKQFDALLPDTLQLLASTLRAGYSLMQGVEAVSQEVSEPMGRELRRVVTEARLGRPLEESLEGVAERMDSSDFGWAVMAIRIQREVGGNLAELLVTVAETMTERERLRRDVNALTAEGRISAIVLTILPIGLGLFIWSVNPEYMDPLFDKTIGKFMLGGSLVLMLFGFWWMKKTIEIEI